MSERSTSKFSVYQISAVGIFAACVFVATNFRIPFAIPTGNAMIHFGNIFCLLTGMLLGPLPGGLAAGIGSFFFDLTSEYASSAPFTLVFKFIMGYTCGWLAHRGKGDGSNLVRNIASGIGGILVYQIFYIGKNVISEYFIQQYPWETVAISALMRLSTSVVGGIVAAVIAGFICPAFRTAMIKAGFYYKMFPRKGGDKPTGGNGSAQERPAT